MARVPREDLKNIVGHVSQTAVKQWLKQAGLPSTASNSADYYELIERLIEQKKLSLDDIKAAALEIEENGGKRIYLRKVQSTAGARNKKDFEANLKRQGHALASHRERSIKTPTEPTVNYISWSDSEIRIKFSETHTDLIPDLARRRLIDQESTKFAIAVLEIPTGFVQVRLDPPGQLHPHADPSTGQSSEFYYESHYMELFQRLLGCGAFSKVNLEKAAEYIEKAAPRIFRLNVENARTGGNSRQRYSSRNDVRDDPARQGAGRADEKNWVYEELSGYWLPEQSNGVLTRELFMHLKRENAMIRFLADCLASEVDYALSRIRDI